MGIQVGTIFRWYEDDTTDGTCEGGTCVGVVTELTEDASGASHPVPEVKVKWWQNCRKHAAIDPSGIEPYAIDRLWEIGQIRPDQIT